MEDFYDLLGVSDDATADEIERAWRERVHRYHPDVNDDARATAQFKTVKTAHEVLVDEAERAAYDRLGHDTYVDERLDGLPNADEPGDRPTDAADADDTAEGRRADAAAEAGGRRTAADPDDRAGEPGGSGSTAGGESAGAEGRKRRTAGEERGGQASGTRRGERTTATRTGRAAADDRRRPHRPLVYAWIGVALVGGIYLRGLWSYLAANAAAVSAVTSGVPTTPVSALLATQEFVPPGTFAADALAAGALGGVAFGVGAIGLAVGFGAVVARVGRGTALLYAVGGAAPLAALAIGPLTGAPDGVVVFLVVVAPSVTVLSFLLDVGWVLATA